MMRTTSLLLLTVAFLVVSINSASAQFTKVDDFGSYTLGDIDGQSNGSGTWAAAPDFQVISDPTEAGNQVMNVLSASGVASAVLVDANITIADGTTGTLFFRYYRGNADSHVNFGLSDMADPEPAGWGGFEAQMRDQDGQISTRNGGAFADVDNVPLEPENEWINGWIVINNDTDKAEFYLQSDTTYPVQTKLSSGGVDVFDFRNGTSDPLTTFYLRNCCSADGGDSDHMEPWYLDDIYVDSSGANLTNPVPEPSSSFLLLGWAMVAVVARLRRKYS